MDSQSAGSSQSNNIFTDPKVRNRFDCQEEEIHMLGDDTSAAKKSEEQFALFAKWL